MSQTKVKQDCLENKTDCQTRPASVGQHMSLESDRPQTMGETHNQSCALVCGRSESGLIFVTSSETSVGVTRNENQERWGQSAIEV